MRKIIGLIASALLLAAPLNCLTTQELEERFRDRCEGRTLNNVDVSFRRQRQLRDDRDTPFYDDYVDVFDWLSDKSTGN